MQPGAHPAVVPLPRWRLRHSSCPAVPDEDRTSGRTRSVNSSIDDMFICALNIRLAITTVQFLCRCQRMKCTPSNLYGGALQPRVRWPPNTPHGLLGNHFWYESSLVGCTKFVRFLGSDVREYIFRRFTITMVKITNSDQGQNPFQAWLGIFLWFDLLDF